MLLKHLDNVILCRFSRKLSLKSAHGLLKEDGSTCHLTARELGGNFSASLCLLHTQDATVCRRYQEIAQSFTPNCLKSFLKYLIYIP